MAQSADAETEMVWGTEVPKPLADLYNDPLFGLVSVRHDTEGVLLYEDARGLGGRACIEIPHEDPYLVDESDVPGVSPPPMTFEELVAKYDCTIEKHRTNTYVVVADA